MLAQPAQSLTDLALGLVVIALAVRLRRFRLAHRYWQAAFWWAGVAALCGAVHHGVVVRWARWSEISWSIISAMVVVAISYLLAATVAEVLGSGRARAFWLLRSFGLIAYAALALTGHAGVAAILSCESITMLCILALWGRAALQHHPLARPVLLGILASGAAGAVQGLSPSVTEWVGLDPTSAYHLAQIVGMGLVYRAATRSQPRPADDSGDVVLETA